MGYISLHGTIMPFPATPTRRPDQGVCCDLINNDISQDFSSEVIFMVESPIL